MSDLETQDAQSMEDTLSATLADIQSRGVDLEEGESIEAPASTADTTAQAAQRARDEAGRFAKIQAADEADLPQSSAETTEQRPQEKQSRKPPSSWRKEAQDVYAKLDPLAQDEIDRRETDFHKGLEGYKAKAHIAETLERVISPYADNLREAGANPFEAIGYLMGLDNTLRKGSPEQKAQIVSEIMQRAGLGPDSLKSATAIDPSIAALQQQLRQLQTTFQQREHISQQQEMAALNSEIANFAQGKEHFETVRHDMAALLQAGRARNLDEAYDMAVYANPQTRSALLAKQQDDARQDAMKKAQDAKRAAAANIPRRGAQAPASTTTGSMEDTLRATLSKLGIAS